MKKSVVFTLFSVFLYSYTTLAQNYVDIFSINTSVSPNNSFADSDLRSSVREVSADLNLPVVLSPNSAIITGLIYESASAVIMPGEEAVKVHGVSLKLGLNQKFNERLSGTFVLLPRMASDFKLINMDQMQFGGLSLFKIQKNKNFNLKFGGYYNQEFFGPFFVPIAGFYYQRGKWELKAVLPLNADFNYSPLKNLTVGFRYDGLIKSFNLNPIPDSVNTYLAKANNELGFYTRFNRRSYNLFLFAGHTAGRSFRTYSDQEKNDLTITVFRFGDDRTQRNVDFSNGWILKVGVFFRLNID